MNQNLPIAYDFHGDIPFEVPFANIEPKDIHIYLDLDTKTGKNTCEQNCNHCWFVNYEKVHNKSFDLEEGRRIKDMLSKEGYKVFARYVDSFALQGDFMRIHGPAHNREFRQEQDHKPTDTMKKGDAWTSGRPLLADNYVELLDLAAASGYGTISITFHGLIGEDGQLKDEKYYPIKGVFSGANTEKVIARISSYNARPTTEEPIRVNIGLTIGKHNHSREALIRYAHYFNALGIDTLRFNNFTDHGGRHPHLPLSKPEIEQFYRDLKWLHENIDLNFQLAVSEDFGSFGVEVMGFPKHVGWCRAGKQLFTVIPSATSLLMESAHLKVEKIGDIVACVNIFEPYFGYLYRKTDLQTRKVDYGLEFDHQAIDKFSQLRANGFYKNGCFAKEMLLEKKPEITKQARMAIQKMQKQHEASL
jgi:hypothetical protein